ncbi:hypothetical protein GGR50DRAFT_650848 [Xylaria sp. CBS 124048]|nr:hypothetical protein GGR50DRAFT_650848 [Xylaria sp. CBS 124048]
MGVFIDVMLAVAFSTELMALVVYAALCAGGGGDGGRRGWIGSLSLGWIAELLMAGTAAIMAVS